jgi:hypothetical protein
MELKHDNVRKVNGKEVKAPKAGAFAGIAVLTAGLALASCASQKNVWETELTMVETVRRHETYGNLECVAKVTPKNKALICGAENTTVKEGDTILALEGNKPREFYFLLKVRSVGNEGVEIQGVLDVLGLVQNAVTPFTVKFGETREYTLEGADGSFTMKVERGEKPGTAIVSLGTPDAPLNLTLN